MLSLLKKVEFPSVSSSERHIDRSKAKMPTGLLYKYKLSTKFKSSAMLTLYFII